MKSISRLSIGLISACLLLLGYTANIQAIEPIRTASLEYATLEAVECELLGDDSTGCESCGCHECGGSTRAATTS